MKSTKIKMLLMVTAVSVILSAGGSQALALTGYGSFAPSTNVKQAFDRFQIDSNLNYYLCGSETVPDAIIGIDKGFTLNSDLWQPIEVTPKVFRRLVLDMQKEHGNLLGANHQGFAILDDKGKQIGVWYSELNATNTNSFIKMEDKKNVHVQTVKMGH
ncbi:MAG TPA: hypothetical protein DCZ97_01440 [Syntrophus sp. (in: bacteria)]|nr:hypothetical protein [Syntrophus sp. (in: bacteria)]